RPGHRKRQASPARVPAGGPATRSDARTRFPKGPDPCEGGAMSPWMGIAVFLVGCGGASRPVATERTIEGEADVEIERVPIAGDDEPHARPQIDPNDPGTFPHDQPSVKALRRWN